MTNAFIDPVVREYLLLNSRLRSLGGRVILIALVVILLILSYFGWRDLLTHRGLLEILLWVPYSILGSVLGYLLIAFLDRERRVRFFHFLTIASVLFVTTPISALLNDNSPAKYWTVGLIEEGCKILPVLLLALYVPNLIRTRKDGIVYGALAGMGLNLLEIGIYIAKQLHSTPLLESLYMHSTRLGLWGLGGHVIFSAFVGLGIGFAAESTARGWQKWKRAIIFYLLMAFWHSMFDMGASAAGFMPVATLEALLQGIPFESIDWLSAGRTPGVVYDGFRYGTYLYNIVFLIVLIVQVRRSFALEN